jgi:nucleoside-diphosphate-sugar epimerase
MKDLDSLKRLTKDADWVFHCAAELKNPNLMPAVNIGGTELLLTAMKDSPPKYFCHLSSAGVIGRTRLSWVAEDSPCHPLNTYEATKLAAERAVSAGSLAELTVILRPTNVVDVDRPEAIAWATGASLTARAKVVLKGSECAHLVHARDVARAAMHFADTGDRGLRTFFVSLDDDPYNWFSAISPLAQAIRGGASSNQLSLRHSLHLPSVIPFLVRRLARGPTNRGTQRYSSEQLRASGFLYEYDVPAIVREQVTRSLEDRSKLR